MPLLARDLIEMLPPAEKQRLSLTEPRHRRTLPPPHGQDATRDALAVDVGVAAILVVNEAVFDLVCSQISRCCLRSRDQTRQGDKGGAVLVCVQKLKSGHCDCHGRLSRGQRSNLCKPNLLHIETDGRRVIRARLTHRSRRTRYRVVGVIVTACDKEDPHPSSTAQKLCYRWSQTVHKYAFIAPLRDS